MKAAIKFIIIITLLFFPPSLANSQPVEDVVKKADGLQNSVSADAEHEGLIKMLKEDAARNPNSFDIQWRTARAIIIWADQINMRDTLDNAKKVNSKNLNVLLSAEENMSPVLGKKVSQLGAEAKVYAEKAISLNPERVEGYYYNGLAISMYSLGKGVLSALSEGIRPKLVDALKKAIEKDKAYDSGGPLRVYGRYFYKVPWPYKDKMESERFLQEALKVSSDNLRSNLYLGDTLYTAGRLEDARKQWTKLLNLQASDREKILESVFKDMAKMRLERF